MALSTEVLGYVTAVVLGKTLLIALVIRFLLRRGVRTALLSGLALAQTGEFSFVLATEASEFGLLGRDFQQVFVAGSVVTLIATPFLMRGGPLLMRWFTGGRATPPAAVLSAREGDALRDHGVLIGFGLAGRNAARVLRAIDVPYIATETNPSVVEEARARGERIVYGDATRRPLLERLGVARARFIVVAVSDPIATREIVTLVRTLAPDARILAKTRYILELDPLSAQGADVVVAEELEGTIDLVAEILRHCDIAEGAIARFTGELREEGYQALRAPPGMGIDPWLAEILQQIPTDWVDVPDDLPPGATLQSLGVRARTGASVLVVERSSRSFPGPSADFALEPGDRLLIFGSVDAVDRLNALLHERDIVS
jgi:CPA2 family monovalent cation:H+ antiporter-2